MPKQTATYRLPLIFDNFFFTLVLKNPFLKREKTSSKSVLVRTVYYYMFLKQVGVKQRNNRENFWP